MEDSQRKLEQVEADSDSVQLARACRQVLDEHKIDIKQPDLAVLLDEINEGDPEETIGLVMDLMGAAGLEPDEALAQVMERCAIIEEIKPNPSQKVAAICGALLDEHHKSIKPQELEAIAQRSGAGAIGTAADLLVQHGIFTTTQQANDAIDPDGSLRAEIDAQ